MLRSVHYLVPIKAAELRFFLRVRQPSNLIATLIPVLKVCANLSSSDVNSDRTSEPSCFRKSFGKFSLASQTAVAFKAFAFLLNREFHALRRNEVLSFIR